MRKQNIVRIILGIVLLIIVLSLRIEMYGKAVESHPTISLFIAIFGDVQYSEWDWDSQFRRLAYMLPLLLIFEGLIMIFLKKRKLKKGRTQLS